MMARGVYADTVRAKLRLMTEALDDLASLGEVSYERLRDDRLDRAVVERLLSRVVDLAVDINTHVTVARLQRAPADYFESFVLAARAELLPRELADVLAPSTALRTAIIHVYLDLDLARLADSVPRALHDYRRYVREVARSVRDDAQDPQSPAPGDDDSGR